MDLKGINIIQCSNYVFIMLYYNIKNIKCNSFCHKNIIFCSQLISYSIFAIIIYVNIMSLYGYWK